MKRITKLSILFGITALYGFEVNTHQAITRCAVVANSEKCQTEGSKNLDVFILNSGISTEEIYNEEKFEKYGNDSYKVYSRDGEGFTNYDINITGNYTGLIEAGSILEDAVSLVPTLPSGNAYRRL